VAIRPPSPRPVGTIAVIRGCAWGPQSVWHSRFPVSPPTAGRHSCGASRFASWTAASKAATPACSSSSAPAAAIIHMWITPRSRRGFSGFAGRARYGRP